MGKSFGAVVRRADGADLPMLHQLRISLQRFIQRGVGIVAMGLIKINVVRLQPPQRIFRRTQDVSHRKTFSVRSHLQSDFGGDDDLVTSATLLQPFADNSFRFTTTIAGGESGINISTVDQTKSGGDESIEQLERRSFSRRPTKDVSAECPQSNLQA